MLNNLINKAISAALHADWQEAIFLNLEILKQIPNDIPALNRLAKAYAENGESELAQKYYQNVLELDRFNAIALKNSKNINHHQKHSQSKPSAINLNFIDEPGKTKTIPLTRLGDSKILVNLIPGQIVHLALKNHAIHVCTDSQEHIGALTDDVAFTLKKAIELGNKYQVTIKSCSTNKVVIFIREIFRDDRLQNTPTFNPSYLPQ